VRFLIAVLVPLLLMTLVGAFILRLALWPAFKIAGANKGKRNRLMFGCLLMAFLWTLGVIAWQLSLIYAVPPRFTGHTYTATGYATIVVLSGWFPLAGYAAGAVARRTAPLPRVAPLAAVAGTVFSVAMTIPYVTPNFWNTSSGFLYGMAVFTAWFVLPIAAIYYSAFLQRKKLNRFTAQRCVPCGYEAVAHEPRCTECGAEPHFLCAKCRHVVDARPGDPCPKCKTPIAAACWNCGYDWTGADARCPECGVWKPAAPAPAPATA